MLIYINVLDNCNGSTTVIYFNRRRISTEVNEFFSSVLIIHDVIIAVI